MHTRRKKNGNKNMMKKKKKRRRAFSLYTKKIIPLAHGKFSEYNK